MRWILRLVLSCLLRLRETGVVFLRDRFRIALLMMFCSMQAFAQLPSQAEYDALMDLYESTNGEDWTIDYGWSDANPNVVEDVSGWWGITVDEDGHIFEIWLAGSGLSGILPASLANLSHLQYLDLSFNDITGTIPTTLGNMQSLHWLDLSYNQLNGQIPSSLGAMSNLNYLYLAANSLDGPIPSSLGSSSNLSDVNLSNNLLTGTIPQALTTLDNYPLVDLSYNHLEGTIPAGLTGSYNLEFNYLHGPVPDDDVSVELAGNNFTFSDLLWLIDYENYTPRTVLGSYTPQRTVDAAKVIRVDPGNTVTLTTAIDISTTPASKFRWYRVVNGVTTALNQEGVNSYTYIISNATSADTAGAYFYTIKNELATDLVLTSNLQRISFEPEPDPEPIALNYVTENRVLVEGKLTVADVDLANVNERSSTSTYIDGLGRPIQRVEWQASPFKHDIIAPTTYDEFGREARKYLPVVFDNDGSYKLNSSIISPNGDYVGKAQQFYSNLIDPKVASDDQPFSQVMFEPSPLNRPVKEYGAGDAWSPSISGDGKPVEFTYTSNIHGTGKSLTEEAIIAWRVSDQGVLLKATPSSHVAAGGYYKSGQLYIKVSTDENGYMVREYVDKNGRTVLRKVQAEEFPDDLNDAAQWASTYYIFDDRGNLVFVLQPEGIKKYLSSH